MVLGVVAAAATLGRPISAQDASPAMRYLPASGSRVVLENSDGSDTVAEYYSTFGGQVWQSGPTALGYGASFDEVTTTSWVRIVEVTADAAGRVSARNNRVLAVEPAGLELRVNAGDKDFLAFEPGLPVLPAGVHDGQQWTAAGTATLGSGRRATGRQPYAATLRASARDGGCIAITSELTVGRDATPTREVTTWCPGRGAVAVERNDRTATAVASAPRWQSAGRVTAPNPPALTGGWNFTRRNLNVVPLDLYASVSPVLLPGPVVVYVNSPGGDLVARGWSDGEADPRWNAHPGGQVTSAVAIGRVVVAATTERTVVAYGDHGEFLWQASLGDVSAVPLVRFGALVVVAGLDGRVTAFDAETGRTAWTVQTSTEIRQPMVTDGETLTVLDQAGNLLDLGADGTVLHEFATEAPEVFAVADGIAVVASRGDSYVRGYRLTDGEPVWRVQLSGTRRSMDAFGTAVVIGRPDELVSLRAADGVQLWAKPLTAVRVAALGDRLIVADRTTLRLLDASGAELAGYPTQEPDLSFGAGAHLVADAGELFCFFGRFAYRREAA